MDETPSKAPTPRSRRRRTGWSIKLTPLGLLLLLLVNMGLLALVVWPLLEMRQYLPSAQTATYSLAQSSHTHLKLACTDRAHDSRPRGPSPHPRLAARRQRS